MKIAILGTKGIPNNYGGFEQFAEYLSVRLVERGHDVTVYNPNFHPYKEASFKGVKIVSVFNPESVIGGAANFIYDHLCLRHALACQFDIIYEAGYHSVAFSYLLLGIKSLKKPVLITNMDGIEWKRSKWNRTTQGLIKKLEKIAVSNSPYLISDNKGIQEYYQKAFNKESFFIPYGADAMSEVSETSLVKYKVIKHQYLILVARLEPENNIEVIIEGYLQSNSGFPLVVVGNHKGTYGEELKSRYTNSKVLFVGAVYNKNELDTLRHFSIAYFHGHSVGGTNPSLLEAMACHCFIIAHRNEFNRSVLEESALYFSDAVEAGEQIFNITRLRADNYKFFDENNSRKIVGRYSWDTITTQHEELFTSLLSLR
jgi:glycosyltransferase involved in cell wall biosynthesis